VSSPAYGDHAHEIEGAVDAVHVAPEQVERAEAAGLDAIVDVMWHVFDPSRHGVRQDVDEQLGRLAALLAGHERRVRAFYVFDEPYIDANAVPRRALEDGIARVKARFPGIPTYVTFAHHCFDPEAGDVACSRLVPSDRGVPSNLDWVSFDWYATDADADAHVESRIRTGVDRLAALTSAKIVLTPEAFVDATRSEETTLASMRRYYALAARDPRVFGIDWFLWADAGTMKGLHSLPRARALVRTISTDVRRACRGER
jgi:hypothetical protein